MELIKDAHKKSGLPILERTPIVSPLYPGQFCYCLDEVQWMKYGDFVDVAIGDSFEKIQPAIRIHDFENFYLDNEDGDGQHLALFILLTIVGGKVIDIDESKREYAETVEKLFAFFMKAELDSSRLKATYFSGNTAKNIEMSRKKEKHEKKILVDKYIKADDFQDLLLRGGLSEKQLKGVNTRDNYLTLNWYNLVAPWGYRNEFFYLLPNGQWLDIGTIERLNTRPIVRITEKNESFVIGLEKWNRSIIIDGIGFERILMAKEGVSDILDTSLLKPLVSFLISRCKNYKGICEALRTLHRIFTDVEWCTLSRHQKKRVKTMIRHCGNLPIPIISDFLHLHAEQYAFIFPELVGGIERTLEEIAAYRKRVGLK